MPNTAPRAGRVPRPARDKVEVAVEDCLACSGAIVRADVKTLDRRIGLLDLEALACEQLMRRVHLRLVRPK